MLYYFRVMPRIQKSAQLCATTRYMASCDWCKCDDGPCGDTPAPITTRHVTLLIILRGLVTLLSLYIYIYYYYYYF